MIGASWLTVVFLFRHQPMTEALLTRSEARLQKVALSDIYSSIGSPILTNWVLNGTACPCFTCTTTSDQDCILGFTTCWYGVTCNDDVVKSLDLESVGGGGTLPTTLGLLTDLTSLKMGTNQLFGTIPSQLGQLINVNAAMELQSNQLSGPIPSQLGRLTGAGTIYLQYNSLCSTVPAEVAALAESDLSYTVLNTVGNEYLGTPCAQRALGDLYAATSGPSWTNKKNWMNGTACPCSSTDCWHGVSCEGLDVAGINLGANHLVGTLPSSLGTLTAVANLFDISSNFLHGTVPSELGFLLALTEQFLLDSNSLSGQLPSQLGQMTHLASAFSLHRNFFSGFVPSELGLLTGVTAMFSLFGNLFSGTIPSEVGRLTGMLNDFYLHSNFFSGEIPSELGQMTRITTGFSLNENYLTGEIPSQLGRLSALTSHFDLSNNNNLCSDVPAEVEALSSQVISGWNIEPGNVGLGTPCCEVLPSTYTCAPTPLPSKSPSFLPTALPTGQPTPLPTEQPSFAPTPPPTPRPSLKPSQLPSSTPTPLPTGQPTPLPSEQPSFAPTPPPTPRPSPKPSQLPSSTPTSLPTGQPTRQPTVHPTALPTSVPTLDPTPGPSGFPTPLPTLHCPPGSFLNEEPACEDCPPGQFSNVSLPPWPQNCTKCQAGSAAPSKGSHACMKCAKGKFSGPNGDSCDTCKAGEFVENRKACATCSLGRYAPTPQTGECLVCRAGSHTDNVTGSTTCSPCNAGSFSQYASAQCSLCSPGSWSPSGHTSCLLCIPGRFSATSGSSSCSLCTVAEDSEAGATSCNRAAAGYYLAEDGTSLACPIGAECDGGETAPRPKVGFWVERRDFKFKGIIVRCPRNTCSGAAASPDVSGRRLSTEVDCWNPSSYTAASASICNSDQLLCRPGARRALCSSCAADFSYSPALQICVKCERTGYQALIFMGIFCLGVAVELFANSRGDTSSTWCRKWWLVRAVTQIDSGACRIVMGSFQIIQSVSWTMNVSFPEPFSSFMGLLSLFSFDFLSVPCVFGEPNVFFSVAVWALVPLVLFLANLVVFLARRKVVSDEDGARALFSRHSFYALVLSFSVLPPVTLKLLQMLDCLEVANRRYLRIDTIVSCSSKKYKTFVILDAVFLCLYLSIPVIWLLMLIREKQWMDPWTSREEQSVRIRNSDPCLAHLRFLFGEYKVAWYFMEPLETYRRIFFIGVLPLISAHSSRRAACGLLFASASAAVYREAEPFWRPSNNMLIVFAQYCIFVTFVIALAIETELVKNSSGVLLGCILLGANLAFLFLAVSVGIRASYEQRHWKISDPLSTQELHLVEKVMLRDDQLSPHDAATEMRLGTAINPISSPNHVISQHSLDASCIKIIKRVGAGRCSLLYLNTSWWLFSYPGVFF